MPISSGLGAHYRRLQEFVGPSGSVGSRREVEAVAAPFQWPSGADRFGSLERCLFKTPLGIINVIFAALGRTDSCPSRVIFVARLSTEDSNSMPKRVRIEAPLVLGFLADDKIRIIQPHDDALVVILRIGGV